MSKLAVPVGANDHVLGDLKAPVVLVEYGDYQCPYCGQAAVVVQQAVREFGAKLCVALAVRVRGWWWRLGAVYVAACALSSSWPSGVDWGNALGAPLSWPLALVFGAVWWGAVVWALRAAWGRTSADQRRVAHRG